MSGQDDIHGNGGDDDFPLSSARGHDDGGHLPRHESEGASSRDPEGDCDGGRSLTGTPPRREATSDAGSDDAGVVSSRQGADGFDDADQPLPDLVGFSQRFSGPLPPPALLAEYEQVHPGLADRIASMAETALDADVVPAKAEAFSLRFATIATAIVPPLALIAGFILVLLGQDGVGFILAVGGLASYLPHIVAATRRALVSAAPDEERN